MKSVLLFFRFWEFSQCMQMLSFFEECIIMFQAPAQFLKKRCLEYYFPLRSILAVAHIIYSIYIHTHPLLSDSCLFLLVESSSLMNSAPFLGPSISPPKKPHLATLIHDVEALFVLSKGGPGFPILQPDLLTKVDFKNLGSWEPMWQIENIGLLDSTYNSSKIPAM